MTERIAYWETREIDGMVIHIPVSTDPFAPAVTEADFEEARRMVEVLKNMGGCCNENKIQCHGKDIL